MKKILQLGFVLLAFACCNSSCVKGDLENSGDQKDQVIAYTYDGCIYLKTDYRPSEQSLVHSATCDNPRHGGIAICNDYVFKPKPQAIQSKDESEELLEGL